MRILMAGWLAAVTGMGLAGCGESTPEEDPASVADSFSEAYFNYDFMKASRYTTAESRRWLSYAASNVYEADIEVLRGMESGATVEIDGVDDGDTDSTAMATVRVDNYMLRDTIGRSGRVVSGLAFRLPMVKRGGKWLVHLSEMPRSSRVDD